jgi:hypothetical protein
LLVEIEQRHGHDDIRELFKAISALGYDGFFLRNERLYRIEAFDPAVDQDLRNFGGERENYINNFLFLSTFNISTGRYDKLFEKFVEAV